MAWIRSVSAPTEGRQGATRRGTSMAAACVSGPVALLLALALSAFAEDEAKELAPLAFDEVNTSLDQVIAKATAAEKLIFIDFFLDG